MPPPPPPPLPLVIQPPPPLPPPLPLKPPPPPKKNLPPQEIVDEFWKEFSAKSPSKATTVIPQNEYADKAAKGSTNGPERTTQSSYAEAAEICRTKVRKIADECRAINRKYRDPHFDLEYDLKCSKRDSLESINNRRTKPSPANGDESDSDDDMQPFKPRAVKRVADIFDEPQFFIDGPSMQDVRQGNGGDCWLLAALCTLSNKKGLIERVCVARDEQVGVYGFVFHRDGAWFSEIIDDKLYLKKPDYDESFIERMLWEDRDRVDSEEAYRRIYQSNSGALYFSQCEHPNETWLPLLEKCYAKAHGDYACIEGGFTGEGIEDLTGGVTTEIYTSDILDREAFWKNELMQVNKEFLFGCSTGIWGRGLGNRKGIVELHAYSVMRAVEIEGKRLVLLKNPWGKGEWKGPWSDGSKEWTAEWLQRLDHKFGDDGAFWISYSDLLRKYQAFDRTRLFGDDWRVASIWTTLAVPWKQDYHDTHFGFTLSTGGDVVIVLSQLDDRYFRGLEGQYTFTLAFRLHRTGQEDYIVRTPPAYRMSRSVNVEVKLEAGDYTVMVKVDATRNDSILPVEDVVRNNAKTRREKLLRIGLAYDLAHSKGRYKETEEEKGWREAHEKRVESRKRESIREMLTKDRVQVKYFRRKKQDRDAKEMKRMRAKADRRRREKREKKGAQQQGGGKEVRLDDRGHGGRPDMRPPVDGRRHTTDYLQPRDRRDLDGRPDLDDRRDLDYRRDRDRRRDHHDRGDDRGFHRGPNFRPPPPPPARHFPPGPEGDEAVINAHASDSDAKTQKTPSSPPTGSESGQVGASNIETQSEEPKAEKTKTDEDTNPKDGKEGEVVESEKPEIDDQSSRSIPPISAQEPEGAEEAKENKPKDAGSKEGEGEETRPGQGGQPAHHQGMAGGPRNYSVDNRGWGPPQGRPSYYDGPWPNGRHPHPHPHPHPHMDYRPRSRSRGGRSFSPRYRPGSPARHPYPPPPRHIYREPEEYSQSESESSMSDTLSISTVSDVTDREIDIEMDLGPMDGPPAGPPPPPPNRGPFGPPPPRNGPPPPLPLQPGMDDKLDGEADPWNAVVVVGLRIYHKISEEQEDKEVVKLRVVRPNPYSDDEASSADDKGEKKKEKSNKKKRGKSKGLDVDDSAKDATLVGTEKERKRTIDPTQVADSKRNSRGGKRLTYRPAPRVYETD